jgi:hypothetical protein
VIFNINLLDHFEDAEELRMADSLRDPRESAWMGDTVCADRAHRKRFDRVRRRLSEIVRIDAPAPDLDHVKVVQSLLELVAALASRKDDDQQELCLVLEPSLRKYDFPGYKTFENFVRGRIHPKSIIGVVGPAALTASQRVRRVAEISGHALYQVESPCISEIGKDG